MGSYCIGITLECVNLSLSIKQIRNQLERCYPRKHNINVLKSTFYYQENFENM